MKAKFMKFLRLVGYVVPLMVNFIKRLALGLIKKLTALATWARRHLDRANNACGCPTTDDEVDNATQE